MKIIVLLLSILVSTLSFAKVTETRLSNGLKIIIKEDHRFPVMVSQIWYKVGSSYEYGGLTGLSHMLEHMMFKGTKNLKPKEFSQIISANGGRQNAFTGRDYTAYFQRMSNDKYPISFKLESDRMRNLLLEESEFKKERDVVTEERRMRTEDNPISLAYEQFFATAYVNSPYHHPVIGWAEDIKNYQLEDLQTWYKKWYAPNNATLVVVGDVKPEEVIFSATKWFSSIPKSELTLPKPQTEISVLGEKSISVYSEKVKVPTIIMGYFVPSIKTSQKKWEPYALEVLAYILDGGKSSRLNKELVRDKKIASSIGLGYDPLGRLSGLFTIQATPTDQHDIATLKKEILFQLDRVKTQLVNQSEINRIITKLVAQQTYEKDSIFYQAMKIGQAETVGLSWKDAESFVDKIKLVTAEQVKQVAIKYLQHDKLITTVLKTKK